MTYSIDEIPFSRYGSYFVISRDPRGRAIYLRDLHGGDETPSNLFRLSVLSQDERDITGSCVIEASETHLRIEGGEGSGRIWMVWGGGDTLHVRLEGLMLRLDSVGSRYDSIVPHEEKRWEAFYYQQNRKIMIMCREGSCRKFGSWQVVGEKDGGLLLNSGGQACDVVLDNYRCTWKKRNYPSFDEAQIRVKEEYAKWVSSLGIKGGRYQEQIDLASYLLWTNFVRADGILPYDALYCSKNWMNNIWSWDNCFMAIALSKSHPKKAYEQLSVFFRFQDETGCYPDYTNDVYASYSCCKPPIHAWAFCKMRRQNKWFSSRSVLEEVYRSFHAVAMYWTSHRIPDGWGLPTCNHGNDSGWDNASVYHMGMPVSSPDLSAYLIRQLDILSALAEQLGYPEERDELSAVADRLFSTLMERHFDGERFFAVHIPSKRRIAEGDSLCVYLPIVIGYRMERPVLDRLVKDLLERFEGPYGLCTENPQSSLYKKGGYWLGSIWAPVTYIFIDALRENGYGGDARRLAKKFCDLTKTGKMAENYDAFTGEGFDDPAFSWSSAVFLQLLQEFGLK